MVVSSGERPPVGAASDVPATADRVGWFRFHFDSGRWEWSDEVYRIHGYEPGAVALTTNLVLSHKHPDDVDQVAAALEDIQRTRRPLSSRHRIIDARGVQRSIVLVGDLLRDHTGAVVGTHGFYIDVGSSDLTRAAQRDITTQVALIAANRTPIDLAKGMLMLIYGVDEDTAFEVLRWRSQETNTKVRALAKQLANDFMLLTRNSGLQPVSVYDQLLVNVHQRVTGDDE